jgi:putative membrane-bound dehydrogenase-like protein
MIRRSLLASAVCLAASLIATAVCLVAPPAPAPAGETPKPLKALFLGDNGHHQPAYRAEQLIPVMAGRGIDITYTEDLSDLNPSRLAGYDALIVYANIDNIGPGQEKAVLDYVAGGGGFVPLHCASYCFRNSAAYVALVGAQFSRHGTGTFDTKVVDPDHPIMKGLEPFRTWDETYVHTKHNPKDRVVLQVRAEGDGEEPWTWVRTQGKGRVFYTAYGHDARTWGHPGFHDLVERGIRWAAGKGEVFDSRPRVPAGLKPFEYETATADIPNYVPSNRWGTQGDPISRMQLPASPAESMKHLALPRGFEPKLFAAEPAIAKPIAMAWDHRGRLWIAETFDYPNNKQPRGQGHDRISICEDSDGDGRADKFTVFADGLSIPTSLVLAEGGVIVTQAPEVLFLKDTDGDDKADVRKVLFTGWDTGDTHAGPSNLRYGFDGWIYGMDGYSGYRGTVGGEPVSFRQGFFRFKPDGSKLEYLRGTSNNSWGVGFSEEGLIFGSTANACPSVYLPIPNRYYEKVRGWSPRGLENIADSTRFFPATDKVRQVDWHGSFTAGAGHALYTARTYPQQYWNRTAFVAEPTGHLVATFTLHPHGADFVSHNAWNLVASDDEWTSPVAADVGPDGHVWVIDWYNYIVQHNPTPKGFRTGKGNAYETPLRDKTHGRIYRLVAKDGTPSTPPRLDPADPKTLVAALTNDNMLWRMHAQRLLAERGKGDVVSDLVRLVRDRSVDAIGLNPGAIHALWALNALKAFDGPDAAPAVEAAVAAMGHPSAGVRRNALLVLPRDEKAAERIVSSGALRDADAQVQLAALLALSELPPSDAAGAAVAEALASGAAERDRWLTDGATAAAAAHDRAFLRGLAARKFARPAGDSVARVAARVAEHYARGVPADSVGGVLAALDGADRRVAESIIEGLARGWPKGRPARLDESAERAIAGLSARLSPEARGRLLTLAATWGSRAFEKRAAELAASFLATVRDESQGDRARADAARELIDLRRTDPEAAKGLLDLVTPRTAPALASGIVEAVGRSEAPGVGATLVDRLASLTPTARPVALRALLGRADWSAALMDGLEQGKVRLAELALDQTQALTTHPNRSIASRARRLLASGGGLPDPDRQKVIDQLSPVVLRGGDAGRGKEVFKAQCAKCHTHSGEGGKVGPDLTGMAAHPKAELLVHILDPSRSVEGNYVQYTVAMADGRVLNGLLSSETKTSIELLDAEGKAHAIQRSDIEELAASKKSLMPEGFEKQVPPEGLADLLEFMARRGKYLPLDIRKVATAVSTRGMFTDPDADIERLIFADWSPKEVEGIPFQLVDPRGDRDKNAIELQGPQSELTRRLPRSVSLVCNSGARAIHLLGGVGGWAFPYGDKDAVSMIVRLHYADGKTEDHPLRNGIEIADYIRPVDVPGSKLAFRLRGQQIRYLAVRPQRPDPIERIELVKGPDEVVPVVMAVTVETTD